MKLTLCNEGIVPCLVGILTDLIKSVSNLHVKLLFGFFKFYIWDNTLLAIACSWITCSWTVRILSLNNSEELGSWPWWRESWIGINGCGGFENEKGGNGCPPEINGWAGSIYDEFKRSLKFVFFYLLLTSGLRLTQVVEPLRLKLQKFHCPTGNLKIDLVRRIYISPW